MYVLWILANAESYNNAYDQETTQFHHALKSSTIQNLSGQTLQTNLTPSNFLCVLHSIILFSQDVIVYDLEPGFFLLALLITVLN